MNNSDFPKSLNTISCDNQIGQLHEVVSRLVTNYPSPVYINFENHQIGEHKIMTAKNVLPIKFAKEVRNFLQSICHFDPEPLNDETNWPNDICFTRALLLSLPNCPRELIDRTLNYSLNKLDTSNYDNPNLWEWERYSSYMWRLTPVTLDSFYHSPIYKLITDVFVLVFPN